MSEDETNFDVDEYLVIGLPDDDVTGAPDNDDVTRGPDNDEAVGHVTSSSGSSTPTNSEASVGSDEVHVTGSPAGQWCLDRYMALLNAVRRPFSHGQRMSPVKVRGHSDALTSRRLSENLHLTSRGHARSSSISIPSSHPAMSCPTSLSLPAGRASPPVKAPVSNGSAAGVDNGGPCDVLSPSAGAEDVALLQMLENANRTLELDTKSMQTLSPASVRRSRRSPGSGVGHSRTGSMSSILSNTSTTSNYSNLLVDDDSVSSEDLWNLWGRITNEWETMSRRKPAYIRDVVRRGIPHHFRGIVWQLLCSAGSSGARDKYADYLRMTSPCEKTIRRDITRTYPEHDLFKADAGGQESLFNVMKAYSLHDREVGYCQGSAFIVGLVLMQMPEEEAFAVLVDIMVRRGMRDLFKPSMAELGLCMYQLESLLQDALPDLYTHFRAHGVEVTMFASSWFLTLFATSLPLPVTVRVFDVFLSEGLEVVFKFGLAILTISQTELMARDMEGILKYLQKELPGRVESEQEALFTAAYSVKYNAKKMKKLEKEYTALKSKEQEEQVELRRLRTENRLLRQRMDNLEKETATLADRLIHDQVRYARQEEQVFALRRDVSVSQRAAAQAQERASMTGSDSGDSSQESVAAERAKDEQIELLQEELVAVRGRAEEGHATVTQLTHRTRELENTIAQLQMAPHAQIQSLQEELIASKLREAESNLTLKELQRKVTEVDKHYQRFVEVSQSPVRGGSAVRKQRVEQLEEEVMSLRLREAALTGELKEARHAELEHETQCHILERQVKRLEDDLENKTRDLEEAASREKSLQQAVKEKKRELADLNTKKKEEAMMSRIKDAEHSQSIAEMRRRIAELEIENQELVTAGQLENRGEQQELENRIADLQDEVLQLRMCQRGGSAVSPVSLSVDSDSDDDDIRTSLNTLTLTDSMVAPTGLGPSTAGLGPSTASLGPSTASLGPSTAGLGPSTAGQGPSTASLGPSTAGLGPSELGAGDSVSVSERKNLDDKFISNGPSHIDTSQGVSLPGLSDSVTSQSGLVTSQGDG